MSYDAGTIYKVKLRVPVTFLGAAYKPLPVHEFTGAALNLLIDQEGSDVVDSAEPR